METITTAIEFTESSKLPPTGDFIAIGIILVLLALAITLFIFRRRFRKLFYASIAGFACTLLCFCLVTISQNNATANKLTDCVSSKITATVGSNVSIENGYIKYFDNDSVLALHGIKVNDTENLNCNWKISYDDSLIYDNKQIFNDPIYVDNSKHTIAVTTDMNRDIANKYIGKSPVCLDFSVQQECRVTGKVNSKSNSPIEGVSAQFISTDGQVSPIIFTDQNGHYTIMAKQGSTGHVHFQWKSASFDSEEFTVNNHLNLKDTIVDIECRAKIKELLYTGSEQIGVEFDDSVEVINGNAKATDIGKYSITLRPYNGFHWDDLTTNEKTFEWSIKGAYVKHANKTLTFYFGTDYAKGDYLVLTAENAQQTHQIPWKSETGTVLGEKVVFDKSMKNYSVSQTAWWFEGGGLITEFVGMDNLNLNLDPNKRGMESMFNGCWLITSLDLSTLNTANSKSFVWMFYNCVKLSNLKLGNFNTESATETYHMFDCCVALKSLDLSSFNTKNVTDMSFMFGKNPDSEIAKQKDSQLETINFGNNFITSKTILMNNMFYQCKNLKELDLSKFDTSSVKDISSFIDTCSKLSKVSSNKVGTFNFTNFKLTNSTNVSWFMSGCSSCLNVLWGDTSFNKDCSIYGFMAYCSKLLTADCAGLDTSNVSYFGEAFRSDSLLTTIYCAKGAAWLGYGDNMFADDIKLQGGNKTKYSDAHINIEYAREDTASNPGYFTVKTT